jgi:uncharacterized protein
VSRGDQAGDVSLGGVKGNACQWHPLPFTHLAAGQYDLQHVRGDLGVLLEGFVKITESKQQDRVREAGLDVEVLTSQGNDAGLFCFARARFDSCHVGRLTVTRASGQWRRGYSGVALFTVTITYGDIALRDKIRPSHREYLKSQFDKKVLVSAGPFADDSGALLIYEAESGDALQAILGNDPYWVNTGCLGTVTVKEWNRVFPPA